MYRVTACGNSLRYDKGRMISSNMLGRRDLDPVVRDGMLQAKLDQMLRNVRKTK